MNIIIEILWACLYLIILGGILWLIWWGAAKFFNIVLPVQIRNWILGIVALILLISILSGGLPVYNHLRHF